MAEEIDQTGKAAAMTGERLDGGCDGGASLIGGTVRRVAARWTTSVQALLAHLVNKGFGGAPRPLGFDDQGPEVVSFIPGETTGSQLPWPRWVHSDQALRGVAGWLSDYHRAVSDFIPPTEAVWREGKTWAPGQIIAHDDAAPYNAVWGAAGLAGFVDWDMAGPQTIGADLAWVAFAWVPLHARSVVAREGFTAFGERRARLETFLDAYGWRGDADTVIEALADRLADQVRELRATADAGDPTYRRMVALGRDRDLLAAHRELADL